MWIRTTGTPLPSLRHDRSETAWSASGATRDEESTAGGATARTRPSPPRPAASSSPGAHIVSWRLVKKRETLASYHSFPPYASSGIIGTPRSCQTENHCSCLSDSLSCITLYRKCPAPQRRTHDETDRQTTRPPQNQGVCDPHGACPPGPGRPGPALRGIAPAVHLRRPPGRARIAARRRALSPISVRQ